MTFKMRFKETNAGFKMKFGELRDISDGGYERGYGDGFTDGENKGYADGYEAGYEKGIYDATYKGRIYQLGETVINGSESSAAGVDTGIALAELSDYTIMLDYTMTAMTWAQARNVVITDRNDSGKGWCVYYAKDWGEQGVAEVVGLPNVKPINNSVEGVRHKLVVTKTSEGIIKTYTDDVYPNGITFTTTDYVNGNTNLMIGFALESWGHAYRSDMTVHKCEVWSKALDNAKITAFLQGG